MLSILESGVKYNRKKRKKESLHITKKKLMLKWPQTDSPVRSILMCALWFGQEFSTPYNKQRVPVTKNYLHVQVKTVD